MQIETCGYQTKRAFFNDMKKRGIPLLDNVITFSPSRYEDGEELKVMA
ncbi:hypothetical protein [Mixta gaviniae]